MRAPMRVQFTHQRHAASLAHTLDGLDGLAVHRHTASCEIEVDVTSDGTTLTIAGARHDRLRAGGVPLRLERPTGKLLRTLRLPDGCDGTKLSAQIRDGVLAVYIPKTASGSTSDEGRELACARP